MVVFKFFVCRTALRFNSQYLRRLTRQIEMASGSGHSAAGGNRPFTGRRTDPIRSHFETIRTPENLGKFPNLWNFCSKVAFENWWGSHSLVMHGLFREGSVLPQQSKPFNRYFIKLKNWTIWYISDNTIFWIQNDICNFQLSLNSLFPVFF